MTKIFNTDLCSKLHVQKSKIIIKINTNNLESPQESNSQRLIQCIPFHINISTNLFESHTSHVVGSLTLA